MNKRLVLLVLLTFSLFSYSQEQRIKASLQYGFFKAGDYKKIQPGHSFGFDLSYFLSEHFFLTAHFNYGINYYYEDVLTKFPDSHSFPDKGNTNAQVILNNIGLLAGYHLPINQWFNITGQMGVSQFIEIKQDFSLRIYAPEQIQGYDMGWGFSKNHFCIAFPVKFNVSFTPFKQRKNIELGYSLGFYIEPDFGFFTGLYHGPQLSLSF